MSYYPVIIVSKCVCGYVLAKLQWHCIVYYIRI